MDQRLLVNLGAALIPLLVGYVWYHPRLLGSILKSSGDVHTEKLSTGHAWWVYPLAYIACYFIAGSLGSVVIHQYGLPSMLANQPDLHTAGTALNTTAQALLDKYADNFRTFKHGAFHGYHLGLYLVLPVIAVITLFEKKKWTYLAIHGAYWIICLALMGGVICAYMPTHIQLAR
jgi:Protein of unknown function (DUF1761)